MDKCVTGVNWDGGTDPHLQGRSHSGCHGVRTHPKFQVGVSDRSDTSKKLNPIHTADATQLSSRVASAV